MGTSELAAVDEVRSNRKSTDQAVLDSVQSPHTLFSSPGRVLVFGVLLPTTVAGTNQLLFEGLSTFNWLRPWLYPWMAFTTAVLSWCIGRYLSPAWLRWTVFAWGLALLNLLTFAACVSGPLPYHFGYVLVSAQISLLIVWAILSPVEWQWRLPGVLVAAPALILFAANFRALYWGALGWHAMMLLVAVVVFLLCFGLRMCGFTLQKPQAKRSKPNEPGSAQAHQFGLQHMFIWVTAMVPFLLVARGLDLFLLARLDAQVAFATALAAFVIATVNLIAIWAVLGGGSWIARLATFLSASLLMAIGLSKYFAYLDSTYASWPAGSILHTLVGDDWFVWLWGQTLLLAALLLFVRAMD